MTDPRDPPSSEPHGPAADAPAPAVVPRVAIDAEVAGEVAPRRPADDHAPTEDGPGHQEPIEEGRPSAPGRHQVAWVGPFVRMGAFIRRQARAVADDPVRAIEAAFSLIVIVVGTAYVIGALHPTQLLRNTTPTGGDMGAHVWGPDYLLHHLLPKGRLSGWTPDWYDGFPAYQFYMVVPSLFVVALTVGVKGLFAIPAAIAALGLAGSGWCSERLYRLRKVLLWAGLILLVLVVPIPYNVSFKLVTVLGLVTLPAAAWAFGKLCDLPFPVPPLCTVAALLFIFNREPLYNGYGNIIGGNMSSTMAGEFAFSISLTFALLYLGVAVRGLRTGRHRGLAALLFALAGLCHLIPAFFVLACTALLFLLHPSWARLKWLATMVPVGGMLTAFWVVPFYLRADFVNDMGWEKLPVPVGSSTAVGAKAALHGHIWYYLLPSHLWLFMAIAAVGILVSALLRHTVGLVLGGAWALVWVAFRYLPEARLWNARLLPFLYLSVFLLCAIAVGEVARSVAILLSADPERPSRLVGLVALPVVALAVMTFIALPMSSVAPDGSQSRITDAVRRDADGYARLSFADSSIGKFLHLNDIKMRDSDPVASWSDWNYSGLQAKQPSPAGCGKAGQPDCASGGWAEYRGVVATMARLGQEKGHGCGRSLWEYAGDRLSAYGTPMALMMLPYFTNECIGSQEGLYFESSTTTPYHFIMQAELSTQPSEPQRDLPYPSFDMTNGVRHLQMLGVKYYLASTPSAVTAADANPDLTSVATSGAWHIYQVSDAPVVEPLAYEPVVMRNVTDGQHSWLDPAVAWFLDPGRQDVPLTDAGPTSWARVTFHRVQPSLYKLVGYVRGQTARSNVVEQLPKVPRKALPKATVSHVHLTDDGVSFDVDKVGVPVLVKVSYFPNWKAKGAQGPYRVTPNLMVVVPTSKHVSMTFGRTGVDLLGIGLTLAGLGGLALLWYLPPIEVPEPGRSWLARQWKQRRPPPWEPDDHDRDDGGTYEYGDEDEDDLRRWAPVPPPAPEVPAG